jgi:histidinol phosphatase-like enzyme (inositol monophosphatase family)
MIRKAFPDDTVQGEEFAEQTGISAYRWIVDPIDGTKSFVCGVALYSTLLALECDGESLGGVIYIPAGGEMIVAATGQGSWYRSADDAIWQKASASSKSDIADAVFVTSQVDSFDRRGAEGAYKRIQKDAWLTRSWGDGYGYLMVATGRADIMIDPECNAWDVAAILPIVNEAGGQFTDWKGNATTRGGDGVGTNGLLHDAVLERLK